MRFHRLKTHPGAFAAQRDGSKGFEFRKDDRGFEVGDVLALHWFDPAGTPPVPAVLYRKITYILRGPNFGVPEGYAVLSTTPTLLVPDWISSAVEVPAP